MARKPEIQYIRYYIDGTAARKQEPQLPQKQKRPLPQKKRRPKYVLKVQPLAVLGVVLSVVLLCMMIGGISEFLDARQQMQQMQERVLSQRRENSQLRETYEESINLEEIQKAALALGMVPEEQVKHITISVGQSQTVTENGALENLSVVIPDFLE